MTQTTYTKGQWSFTPAVSVSDGGSGWASVSATCKHDYPTTIGSFYALSAEENNANARLSAAAPEMLVALQLHKAWAASERDGPNYHGMTRDTHPDGENIWKIWWQYNLDLCDRANMATDTAIAKATGAA